MRVCQPGPHIRKAAKTSWSGRMATCSLMPLPAGLPRRLCATAMPETISSLLSGRSSSSRPSQTKSPPTGAVLVAESIRLKVYEVIFKPIMVSLKFNPAGQAKTDDVGLRTWQMHHSQNCQPFKYKRKSLLTLMPVAHAHQDEPIRIAKHHLRVCKIKLVL